MDGFSKRMLVIEAQLSSPLPDKLLTMANQRGPGRRCELQFRNLGESGIS